VNASGNNLSVQKVLNEVLESPITLREIKESKKLYKDILQKEGNVYCVWTGRKIANYDIDHLIPFSVWKNNDLWNLLPSDSKVNNQKRDKIPTPEVIERQKSLIIDYWGIIYEHQSKRFQKEIQVALLGNHSFDSWKISGISQLQNSCNYLIENRGFEGWKI
jgi:CRISPR/Cas system Type II protein with McrA/HNH and RuvC-like nuclease domain